MVIIVFELNYFETLKRLNGTLSGRNNANLMSLNMVRKRQRYLNSLRSYKEDNEQTCVSNEMRSP